MKEQKNQIGKYLVYKDSGGNRTVGYGVNIEAQGTRFIARGIDPSTIKEGDLLEKELVDAIEDEIISDMKSAVESQTSGLNLTSYQITALVSRYYNCGNIRGFKDAYNKYWKESDDEYGVTENASMYNHGLYTNYMSTPIRDNKGNTLDGLITRRKAEWILFKTGYNIGTGNFVSSGGSIVECAQMIHDYIQENKYTYCVYFGNDLEECSSKSQCYLSPTFEGSKVSAKTKKTCCATFVSWVLQEAGYITAEEHTANNCNGANNIINFLKNEKGFITVPISELEPGDVIAFKGHVEIYAGDGLSYNAGSGSAIRKPSPAKGVSLSTALYGLRAPN